MNAHSALWCHRLLVVIFALHSVALAAGISFGAKAGDSLVLENDHVARRLNYDGRVWRTVGFVRTHGEGELTVDSDEFHILFMDDRVLTIDDYKAVAGPVRTSDGGVEKVTIEYELIRKVDSHKCAPTRVSIVYTLGDEPYLRKQITLHMQQAHYIDRIEVERFSTETPAKRGGRGEPVFVGDEWFFGLEYPAFYSRHTDGNTPKAYSGKYDLLGNYSQIFLEGRDEDNNARPGLIRLMHFPGYARKTANGGYTIVSKTSICGVGDKADPIEIAFMDYLDTIRRPVRSFIHYNNWYDSTGKRLTVDNFVDKVFMDFRRNLDPYGVRIDAMVPDNGWQNKNSIYDVNLRQFPNGMDDFEALGKALQKSGTNLGLWMALNGYSSNIDWGIDNGYAEAVRNDRFKRFMRYYSIVAPRYNAKIRERLQTLISRGDLKYIKHDFNEMCDIGDGRGHLPTDRHGHEASVDAQLELLALERDVQPEIYQNVTNWIWFSPWWLMHCNNLWMLAGDHGVNRNYPQISTRKMAITYRDAHLFNAWGDAQTRPLVPISHLMTHGIIYADRCPVEQPGDTLRDWSDYVVMYYARGLQLKEWYITPTMMTPDRWRVLGQATRWSEENVDILANVVMIGGKPDQGEPYGYVCFKGDNGIVTLRNPSPFLKTIEVPFDESVWYRGKPGKKFSARVIYPYQEVLPTTFVSHKPMLFAIDPYTTMVCKLQPGTGVARKNIAKTPPKSGPIKNTPQRTTFTLSIPDEKLARCDLMITSQGDLPGVSINGVPTKKTRANQGKDWQMSSYDLLNCCGREITITLTSSGDNFPFAGSDGQVDVDLILDRPVEISEMIDDRTSPWALVHGYRRQSSRLYSGSLQAEKNTTSGKINPDQFKNLKAAKLKLRHFGSNGGSYRNKSVIFNGHEIAKLPTTIGGDRWETAVIDLTAAALKAVKKANQIIIHDTTGDSFKVKDFCLAVQTADGRWALTANCDRVHCSKSDWRYAEGTFFDARTGKSAPIKLDFE